MKNKILIVDDEIDLLGILAYNFEKSGYDIETCTSGEELLDYFAKGKSCDLILLDVMMSGMTGFETAKKMRECGKNVPIIFLTALDTESDMLKGFDIGADDYIAKPFSVKEVMARAKAVLSRMPKKSKIISYKNIVIDLIRKIVTIEKLELKLTKTEYALLLTFIESRGRYFSREELLDKVWKDEVYVELRTVDVHIARLRKKLSSAGNIIVSRSGYGYAIE